MPIQQPSSTEKLTPNYKYQRKQVRLETQEVSDKWDDLFDVITEVKQEIAKEFAYMVLSIEHARWRMI